MTFQTQKLFVGKERTLLQAEVQSERLVSFVRLVFAVVFGIAVVFEVLVGSVTLKVFSIQAAALLVLFLYSTFFLLNPDKRIFHGTFAYILVILDVLVVTVMLWSFYLGGADSSLLGSSIASAYFILIIFTALHHRTGLSIVCGVLSICGYSAMYYVYAKSSPEFSGQLHDYPLRMGLLLTAAALGGIVTRNNSRTIRKVISSETRYHSLVHRLPEMLFTLDAQGNFIWANRAASSVLGISSGSLRGRNIRSFLSHPDSMKLDMAGVRGTFGIRDMNGNERFVDCLIQPVEEEEEEGVAFDGIMSDVTDREKAISQREEMVQRLYQFQKMESLGMLASGMAHDFNNILQTVNDLSNMIFNETGEEETRKKVELINETMDDARFLVQELFALGRKKPLDYRHLNLNSLLEQIVDHFSRQLGPNFTLALETPEENLWIEGDPDHLKRIFHNLVGNARDAMPEGGQITISCEKVVNNGRDSAVNIRISDTGTGIAPELTEKVFDPFFTTKKPGKGTGLGLALVRRIVMLHSGIVTIEKSGYEGTVFLIVLPLSEEKELDSDTKVFLLERIPATLLLLDDDSKIRDVLKIFLKEFKYSILEASSGNEAVNLLKKSAEPCPVVIMDWKLGNEDPHFVIRNLRSINPDLIIIVVSGYPPREESVAGMNITRWFTKPYDRNMLDGEIQRALYKLTRSVATT